MCNFIVKFMKLPRIDLLYFSSGEARIDWPHGEVRQVQRDPAHVIKTVSDLQDGEAEWLFFWDCTLGDPDMQSITALLKRPMDAWHAGIQLGLGKYPDVLNYVHPTWLYNCNATADVEHTSFRLSIQACLINRNILRRVHLPEGYKSLAMFGLALGYQLLKQGAIIRYTPDLVAQEQHVSTVPASDELRFAKQFFPLKWQLWIVLNRDNSLFSLAGWLGRDVEKQKDMYPAIHRSDTRVTERYTETVSVLAPTLNRYPYLLRELEQLSKQTVLPLEVLITDQTDEKDRVDIPVDNYPNLHIRYFPQDEKGQCTAWNKLVAEAKGDYVLFLGDDADGIQPDFIEKLLATRRRFDCDMVAANVHEIGIEYVPVNHHYYLSDTFPITLIKKSVVEQAGMFDMFYNKNIRADHDLATRCHLNGALMVFDPSAIILHHRAPVGGLRTHNARVVTNYIAKNSVTKFAAPTSSELYLAKKYFTSTQYASYIKIKYLNQLFITGGMGKRILRLLMFLVKFSSLRKSYKQNLAVAENALEKPYARTTGN